MLQNIPGVVIILTKINIIEKLIEHRRIK